MVTAREALVVLRTPDSKTGGLVDTSPKGYRLGSQAEKTNKLNISPCS